MEMEQEGWFGSMKAVGQGLRAESLEEMKRDTASKKMN